MAISISNISHWITLNELNLWNPDFWKPLFKEITLGPEIWKALLKEFQTIRSFSSFNGHYVSRSTKGKALPLSLNGKKIPKLWLPQVEMYTIYNEPTRSSKMEAPLRENPKARAYPSCNHYYMNLTYTIGPKL